MYDVHITIRPDVLLNTSGWPVTHEQIRLFNTVKGNISGFGRDEQSYAFWSAKQFNTRTPIS